MSFLDNPIVSKIVDILLGDGKSHSKSRRPYKIELIPLTMHGKNARAVLPDTLWRVVCEITHKKYGWKCCECGASRKTRGLECHERWEYSKSKLSKFGVMKMTGLLSLCHECHMGKHIKFAEMSGELPKVKEHLMRTYNLSSMQFDWKVRKALREVKELSKTDYLLDLTYLNKPRYGEIRERLGRSFTDNENRNCIYGSGE